MMSCIWTSAACLAVLIWASSSDALSSTDNRNRVSFLSSRRTMLGWFSGAAVAVGTLLTSPIADAAGDMPDRLDENEYLRRGFALQPMGVSGQAGKSRPETGILLRDGSQVSQDPRSGDVAAEILVKSAASSNELMPVLTAYSSPWRLATGTVFDVECRDPRTGDGVFLAVTSNTKGRSLEELADSFFTNNIFAPTGRFSLYGQPTDIKVIPSSRKTTSNYRFLDVSFATLSQSTQTEIPRKARIVATIPAGASQAVMLIASTSTTRWNQVQPQIAATAESFRAVPAPKSALKARAATSKQQQQAVSKM